MSSYRTVRVDPAAYRPPTGLTLAERAAEQDEAAGGRDARMITRTDGTAVVGSVALRCYAKSRRVYAYLRWSAGPGTTERYLGDVSDSPDRISALRAGWELACECKDSFIRTTSTPNTR
jgi:DNA mismatch endonuclease (patch repair protein)